MKQEVFAPKKSVYGPVHFETLSAALSVGISLNKRNKISEAERFLRAQGPLARRALGEDHVLTLQLRQLYAGVLFDDAWDEQRMDHLREAYDILKDVVSRMKRVFGTSHPMTKNAEQLLILKFRLGVPLEAASAAPWTRLDAT